MDANANPARETRPVSALTRIAIAALQREFRRTLDTATRAAAEVEGVDLEAGWRLELDTGTWWRAAAPKVPAPVRQDDGA